MVVIAFFLCWAPFHAQRLGYVYFKQSEIFRTINEYLMYISGILYYVSSTINPILYNLMSIKYRQAFRKTLCGVETPGAGGNFNNTMRARLNTWDSAADVNAPGSRRPSLAVVQQRKYSTMSTDSAYLPMNLAVREWQLKQRRKEQQERERKMQQLQQQAEEECNTQLLHPHQNGHHMNGGHKSTLEPFDPLVEVEEVSSTASVKETSFVLSFKRRSSKNKKRKLRVRQASQPELRQQLSRVSETTESDLAPTAAAALCDEHQTLMCNGQHENNVLSGDAAAVATSSRPLTATRSCNV